MSFTCKGCPDRTPGCHDHCEKYQKEKAEYEARKQEVDKARAIRQSVEDQRYTAIGKAVKTHGRKYRGLRG